VFAHAGGYTPSTTFVDGMNTAVLVGAVAVGLGAFAAFGIPSRPRAAEAPAAGEPQYEPQAEAA
jgi:hypothetical protein